MYIGAHFIAMFNKRLPSLILLLACFQVQAQYLFPQIVEGCFPTQVCINCGGGVAHYDNMAFSRMLQDINDNHRFTNPGGAVAFQVLVKSTGEACVISHTDTSMHPVTLLLIDGIPRCNWTPVILEGKPTGSYAELHFEVKDGRLTGRQVPMDEDGVISIMLDPDTPMIRNKKYSYKNQSLPFYTFTSWNRNNSTITSNTGGTVTVDQNNVVWYAGMNGVCRFDGTTFTVPQSGISSFNMHKDCNLLMADSADNLWAIQSGTLYRYHHNLWAVTQKDIHLPFQVMTTANDKGEILLFQSHAICSIQDTGARFLSNLPLRAGDTIFFAYRDNSEQLWINTNQGTFILDNQGKLKNRTDKHPGKNHIKITGAAEDDAGNLYFIVSFRKPGRTGFYYYNNNQLARVDVKGKWEYFNMDNSGFPDDGPTKLFYDRFEKVLWIGTRGAGLLRFDLQKSWELFNTQNCGIAGNNIADITQNSTGDLYIATKKGLTCIKRTR